MSKKISIFIHGLRGGGAENVCVTVANGLAARGLDIDLVVASLAGDIRSKELSDKVHLIDLKIKRIRFEIFSIWRYLANSRPDIVLSFNPMQSAIIAIIRCLSFLRFKLVSRNMNFFSLRYKNDKQLGFWHGTVSNTFIRKLYPLSDIIITLTQSTKEDLITCLKLNPEKIKVIAVPLNKKIEEYIKTSSQSNIPKENYLLCIGRLVPEKASHFAIEAFSRIANDYPEYRLKILGKGSLETQLRQQTVDLGISNKVDFEGYQENTIPYYIHAKLMLFTSLSEGFGNVLVESIALGTPVVSFNFPGGPGETIQDGVNGYLVRYQDMNHLTECLRLALNRQWDPKIVSATADRFSSAEIIDEYERVLI